MNFGAPSSASYRQTQNGRNQPQSQNKQKKDDSDEFMRLVNKALNCYFKDSIADGSPSGRSRNSGMHQ